MSIFSKYTLCLILDQLMPEDKLIALIEKGVTCVQLRMKKTSAQEIISTAEKLLKLLRPRKIPLIINDYVELAKAVDADGVHIGQQDMPYNAARELLGDKKIIGLSIQNSLQAKICCNTNVEYFGVGPIYPTSTKLDASLPIGIDELKNIIKILSRPVIAIGGINESNIQAVLQTGVSGIAIASAILKANDPIQAAKKLSQLRVFSPPD